MLLTNILFRFVQRIFWSVSLYPTVYIGSTIFFAFGIIVVWYCFCHQIIDNHTAHSFPLNLSLIHWCGTSVRQIQVCLTGIVGAAICRPWCSGFRYCPDPLGIVTFFLQHLFFAPYNGQYPKEVSLAVNQTTLFGIAGQLMYVRSRDEIPLGIESSSFF